ncbi:MAG: sigma-70 family RNA polymerase sigma factor [Candidatus Brocadiae bacterium]|nr:sigma-70 family RNA polymerase sigma factor [Candidatus Brocadiia bacterium]
MPESPQPQDTRRRRAFEKEALPHMQDLYFAALRLSRNAKDAEDLVQETYLKAFRSFGRWRAGTNFRAWIWRILVNTWVDVCRKRARGPKSADLEGQGMEPEARQEAPSLLENPGALDACVGDDVLRALHALPAPQRLVLLLADVEEFRYRDIARILGIPMGTVMSRLHHARQKMRELLWDYARRQGYGGEKKEAR